jgi:hypothetical protein
MLPGPRAPHESPAVRSPPAIGPHFLPLPPMRFRSAKAQLRNRLAHMATRENSPSDHLCQIVPVKRPSLPESGRPQCSAPIDGYATRSFDLEIARRKHDSQNFFQPIKLGFASLKLNLDRFRWLTHNLQAERSLSSFALLKVRLLFIVRPFRAASRSGVGPVESPVRSAHNLFSEGR